MSNLQHGQAMIVVVSDNLKHARIWCDILKLNNITTEYVSPFGEEEKIGVEFFPDLILIDKYSDDFDSTKFVIKLREQAIVPILLLTPQNNEALILDAYQAGVDECVVKPLGPALFLSKTNAWLRRTWTVPTESLVELSVGGLCLDPGRRQVQLENGKSIKLTNLEFRLLLILMTHPGWIVTTEDLIVKIWGYYGNGDSSVLKNLVYRLRRKIDPDQNNPRFIHTEAGIGYRFQDIQG